MVVTAAVAAHVSSNVLRYSGPPDEGQPCAVAGCGPSGKGTLASAKPGQPLVSPARRTASPDPRPQRATGSAQPPEPGAVVSYRTVGSHAGGFQGEILLSGRDGQPLPPWSLRFGYPSGQIISVWADGPVQHSAHSAWLSSGQQPAGRAAVIEFSVAGQPGPPATCTLNGRPCHYQRAPGDGHSGGNEDYRR